MNYHTVKTADLEALAVSRGIPIPKDGDKTDREALITDLARDDAEQAALAEDAAGGPEGADEGDGDAQDQDAGEPQDAPTGAAEEPESPAQTIEDLPEVGDELKVVFPDDSVEMAEVVRHQDVERGLLELRCFPVFDPRRPGRKPYNRTSCPPWRPGLKVPGWRC